MKKYHIPVLVKESIDGLKIISNGIYVDATFGGGGHSKEILKRLKKGLLFAFDHDKDTAQNAIKDKRFILNHANFAYIKSVLKQYDIYSIDGLIADLGVSAYQLNTPERGFSFRFDNCKLDMRMNTDSKFTAEDIVNTYNEKELLHIFLEYGEINNAKRLVEAIISYRKKKSIETVGNLKKAIKKCVPKGKQNKYYAQVFQALRIELNDELNYLKMLLLQAKDLLKKGGRLVVISYHSLEDRIVKNFIKTGRFESEKEKIFYDAFFVPFKPINKKIIVPTQKEVSKNNQARSAKLRIAERL